MNPVVGDRIFNIRNAHYYGKRTPKRMNKKYRLKPVEQPAKASDPENLRNLRNLRETF